MRSVLHAIALTMPIVGCAYWGLSLVHFGGHKGVDFEHQIACGDGNRRIDTNRTVSFDSSIHFQDNPSMMMFVFKKVVYAPDERRDDRAKRTLLPLIDIFRCPVCPTERTEYFAGENDKSSACCARLPICVYYVPCHHLSANGLLSLDGLARSLTEIYFQKYYNISRGGFPPVSHVGLHNQVNALRIQYQGALRNNVHRYPRPLFVAHFAQGAAQDDPLSNADARGNRGEDRYPYGRDSRMPARPILGGLIFLFGVAAAYVGYAATDQPNPSWAWWWCGIAGWGVMFALVGYGTLLAVGAFSQIL